MYFKQLLPIAITASLIGCGGEDVSVNQNEEKRTLHGQFVDLMDGEYLEGVTTTLIVGANEERVAVSVQSEDETKDGSFQIKDVPLGSHRLIMEKEGYAPLNVKVVLSSNSQAERREIFTYGDLHKIGLSPVATANVMTTEGGQAFEGVSVIPVPYGLSTYCQNGTSNNYYNITEKVIETTSADGVAAFNNLSACSTYSFKTLGYDSNGDGHPDYLPAETFNGPYDLNVTSSLIQIVLGQNSNTIADVAATPLTHNNYSGIRYIYDINGKYEYVSGRSYRHEISEKLGLVFDSPVQVLDEIKLYEVQTNRKLVEVNTTLSWGPNNSQVEFILNEPLETNKVLFIGGAVGLATPPPGAQIPLILDNQYFFFTEDRTKTELVVKEFSISNLKLHSSNLVTLTVTDWEFFSEKNQTTYASNKPITFSRDRLYPCINNCQDEATFYSDIETISYADFLSDLNQHPYFEAGDVMTYFYRGTDLDNNYISGQNSFTIIEEPQ
jgi:hypothetical protein